VVVRGGADGLPNPMPLGEISFCSDSGWRAKDEERIDQLKVIYKAGDWNQTLLQCIAFLAKTDADGKWLIDDGLSSATALLELFTEYTAEKARHDEITRIKKLPAVEVTDDMKKQLEDLAQETDDAFPDNWPNNITEIFANGLKDHRFHKYPDDSMHVRRLWNSSKHSEQNNTYRQTTLVDCVKSAEDYITVHGTDAVKEMTNVLGKGQNSMIKKWVRTAKAFCGPENKAIMDQLKLVKSFLPHSYIFDNVYILGGEKKQGQVSMELDTRRKVAVLRCVETKWRERMDKEDGLGLSTLLQYIH